MQMDAEAERQKAERGISLSMGGSKGKVADVFADSKAEAEGKFEKHKPLTKSASGAKIDGVLGVCM